MTRTEFLAAIAGSVISVKALGETEADGSAPKRKRLLVIECNRLFSEDEYERLHVCLKPFADKYALEFLILEDGMRVVDPGFTDGGFIENRPLPRLDA